jgi:hypothetical protein
MIRAIVPRVRAMNITQTKALSCGFNLHHQIFHLILYFRINIIASQIVEVGRYVLGMQWHIRHLVKPVRVIPGPGKTIC